MLSSEIRFNDSAGDQVAGDGGRAALQPFDAIELDLSFLFPPRADDAVR
jgi:hypothetical protein